MEVESTLCQQALETISGVAVCCLDEHGIVTTWNTGAQQLWGLEPARALGRPFHEMIKLPAEEGIQDLLAQAASEGSVRVEHPQRHEDGRAFVAVVALDALPTHEGTRGYVLTAHELQAAAPDEGIHAREEFRLLVQGVADYAIYLLDPTGHVSNWNSGAQRIKGYAPGDVIGRHYSMFYTPEDAALGEPQRNLHIAAAEGRVETEGWRVRKDGSRFFAHVIIDRISDDDGNLLGFAKVTRDVTERQRAAQELERAREALVQAQKLEAIGQLTGGVAHDFNNLLMAVQGNLELLERYIPAESRGRLLLTNALAGVARGTTLTQRMLAFARRQELDLAPTDLADVVQGMLDLMDRALGPAVRVQARVPAGLPLVTADANQLELCLLNLAVNARDAMPGGGDIDITADRRTVAPSQAASLRPGDYVRLAVTDTGEGMSAITLGRATEPFFTTKGVGKGTGLGLSMVHGIANQCGGALFLHSTPGAGTTAEIWLPLHDGTAVEIATAPSNVAVGPQQAQGDLRVLVVDDDPLVLSTTTEILDVYGYRVAGVSSAFDALAALEKDGPFDLVISDQAMPGMTGEQLAAAIRVRMPGMPIILASGFAELPSDSTSSFPRLQKPYSMAELLAAIGHIFPLSKAVSAAV